MVDYAPAKSPRLPDPSSFDLENKAELLKYLQSLNLTLSMAFEGRPMKTTPRNEYLLIAKNGTIKALRLNDDGTLAVVDPVAAAPGARRLVQSI